MTVFIAGARSVRQLDEQVRSRLTSIYKKHFDVLIGDCYGVDTAVQQFYKDIGYTHVCVYASNGKVRNNLGNWPVKPIDVPKNVCGFDFYKQKDEAMANDADCGFMIWDGKSRGTLRNMIQLLQQKKQVVLYLTPVQKIISLSSIQSLDILMQQCDFATQILYQNLKGE